VNEIVVGYDGSDIAERALARAADIAAAFSAHLVVVSVTQSTHVPAAEPALETEPMLRPSAAGPAGMPMPIPFPEREPLPDPTDLARRQLERARIALSRRQVDAEYVAEVGEPADRLLDLAEQRDADLIVVGHGEHGLLERLFRPAVDAKVARRTTCDLLLVH
jgi:nucleotide-binding universal stress UspA family protein